MSVSKGGGRKSKISTSSSVDDPPLPADIAEVSAAISLFGSLPVNKDTIMSFAQGWDCTKKAFDRTSFFSQQEKDEAILVLDTAGLRAAFIYRRELINFKKLMLHVSQRASDRCDKIFTRETHTYHISIVFHCFFYVKSKFCSVSNGF